jgi:broad-specificity NMP kinase
MGRLCTVKFRGEDVDVEIDHDGGYESDTNCHVIEWHFCGKTPAEHEALAVTEAEEQAIYEQLVERSYDADEPDFL